MPTNNNSFYSDIPAQRIPLGLLLSRTELFHRVPSDWHVIVTDIKGSTSAVHGGLHETVNLVATGSIVTVLNIAFRYNLKLPFFFGGDGATFIVPASIIETAMRALLLYKNSTMDNFGLELRIGSIPVSNIYAQDHELSISKFSRSQYFSIPVLLGEGLNYAERIIKGPDYLFSTPLSPDEELDLTGMQCRWDKIDPPENTEEVVTLLAIAARGRKQSQVFSRVMSLLDDIYGTPEKRQPISASKLRLKTTFSRLGKEMRIRLGRIKPFELIQTWLTMWYGKFYFRTEKGRNYLNLLVEFSDTLVIDGKINTVISGTRQQRQALEKALQEMEENNQLIYGIHVSGSSVMSCYVHDLDKSHIHFVDGGEGGYTKAAESIKQKIKQQSDG